MANYPTVTLQRMAYDLDGTQCFRKNDGNVITNMTQAQAQALNDEGDSTYDTPNDGSAPTLLFPQMRTIQAVYVNTIGGYASPTVEYSANTTNGIDGTWSQLTAQGNLPDAQNQQNPGSTTRYRSAITTVTPVQAIAVRCRAQPTSGTVSFRAFHVYGYITNPSDRLEFWDPVLDQRIDPSTLDHGDVPRNGQPITTQFRLKNLSTTKTANTITLGVASLTDPSAPTISSAHQFSVDGGATYAAAPTLASLAPGAISPVLYVRYTPALTQNLSLWAGRLSAVVTSWA